MSIPYGAIAGGKPSVTQAMVRHLMNNTLKAELTAIAAYYARTSVDDGIMDVAKAIHSGRVEYGDGLDALMEQWEEKNPPPSAVEVSEMEDKFSQWNPSKEQWVHIKGWRDLEGDYEERWNATQAEYDYKLDVLIDRMKRGLENAPVAIVRPDLDPRARVKLGIPEHGLMFDKEIGALLAGRHSSGRKIFGKQYASPRPNSTPIGSYDFIASPDRSVSVAWAFAPPAERAQIFNAHLESARETMAHIAKILGTARTGRGGMGTPEHGHVAWLEFTHHTERAVPGHKGDPGIHTHFVFPNAVFCPSGRVGSLNTAALRQAMRQVDAFYHSRLEHRLRAAGFDTHMDERTGVVSMPAVPVRAQTLFSKRTEHGRAAAKVKAAGQGEIWEKLPLVEQSRRTKDAVQDREQKIRGGADDKADFEGWAKQAKGIDWQPPQTLKLHGPLIPEPAQSKALREQFTAPSTMFTRMADIRRNATELFQDVLQRGAEKARHALMERRMRRVLAMGIRPRGPKNERAMGM